mmetsp:Transcript_37540/g.69977  ORF Transcript_37540/g.69977 Transcript_37540/m.69977 type:complete len:288 (+) Transcript_37540:67-930(+)
MTGGCSLGGDTCWLCEGRDSAACVICGPPAVANACGQSSARVGQDGWCCDDARDERFGNWTHATVEEINLQLLRDSEALLQASGAEVPEALERAELCCRNMEERLTDARARLRSYEEANSGEPELLALALGQRVRCKLFAQQYAAVVEDSKKFARVHEEIASATTDILKRFVKEVSPSGTLGVDQIEIVGAAAELALQCRDRVSRGFSPKLVLDHATKAVNGLHSLQETEFPGLGHLRAHIYTSRAQACLELEMWAQAKQDASAALECDASLAEAKYFLKAAESESW